MAHPDLQAIVDALLPLAQTLVKQHGEFFPVGASMDANGVVSLAAVQPASDQPSAQEVLDLLVPVLQRLARTQHARAVGICILATTRDSAGTPMSTIVIGLEHSNGESLDLLQPFEKRFLRGWRFHDLIASARPRTLFDA